MKLCMVVHSYYLRDARVRRYAEALSERGDVVDVLCLREKNAQKHQVVSGVQIHRIPLGRRRGGQFHYVLEYALFFLLSTFKLSSLHLRKRYDIIHVHNMPDLLVFTAAIPKMLGARAILDMHDPMPEVYMSKYGVDETHVAIRLLKGVERVCLTYADYVITVNDIIRETFIERGAPAKKLGVVRNIADPRLFSPSSVPSASVVEEGAFSLLYVGTISDRHGVDVALEGLRLLVDRIPTIRLDIIPKTSGEGETLCRLKANTDRLGLNGHVQFHSPLPLEEIPRRMLAADVGIYTPLRDIHTDVALSLKVPEFVSMGIPIVTIRTSIMERYFDDSSVAFFQSGNTEEFADCVFDLFKHPEKRNRIAERAKGFLRKYSWQKEKERYLDLIDALCSSP